MMEVAIVFGALAFVVALCAGVVWFIHWITD